MVAERSTPATSFTSYAGILTASGWAPGGRLDTPSSPPVPLSIRVGRRLVPKSMRDGVKSQLTHAVAPLSRRRAAALVARGDLRLHLGCGPNHLRGWANVDLVSTGADLPWDLSRPAPFPDRSAAAIFHEHLLEHLPLPAAIGFLRECHRLLGPGGVLRVGVPNFGRYARDYAGDRELIARTRPGRPTALLAVAELAFCYGHASMWDEETLLGALSEAGFPDPRVCEFGESALSPAPDSAWRRAESLYAEAVRP